MKIKKLMVLSALFIYASNAFAVHQHEGNDRRAPSFCSIETFQAYDTSPVAYYISKDGVSQGYCANLPSCQERLTSMVYSGQCVAVNGTNPNPTTPIVPAKPTGCICSQSALHVYLYHQTDGQIDGGGAPLGTYDSMSACQQALPQVCGG